MGASDVTLVLNFWTQQWPDGLTFLYGLGDGAVRGLAWARVRTFCTGFSELLQVSVLEYCGYW